MASFRRPDSNVSGSAVKLRDINDFLRPSDACILPRNGGMQTKPGGFNAPMYSSKSRRRAEDAETKADDAAATPAAVRVASVTLSDCITCSGCVTSAETVLLDSSSALQAFQAGVCDATALRVVTLSQQVVASFAHSLGLPPLTTARRLAAALKSSGVQKVYDLSFARRFALLEESAELRRRLCGHGALPLLSSACPGFVSFAEKRHGNELLRCLSPVKSPQAIMGTLVKRLLPRVLADGGEPVPSSRVWHACVMMCHDKKLEAARAELRGGGAHAEGDAEVDLVITAAELRQWLDENHVSLEKEADLDGSFGGDHGEYGALGEGTLEQSGGYLEYVLRHVAGDNVSGDDESRQVVYRQGRNRDLVECFVGGPQSAATGAPRGAIAYGFRNVQNVVRRASGGQCEWQYVEVMSCPRGCNNGGGQGTEAVGKLFVEAAPRYTRADICSGVRCVYALLDAAPGSSRARSFFHTTFTSHKGAGIEQISW